MRVLQILLIIIATSLFVSAQTEEKPKAYKFFEYGKISNKLLKEKLESFISEVNKINGRGVVINYGKSSEVFKNVKQFEKNMPRCGYDGCSRITIVRGGIRKKSKTEFWIVPEGAEEPIPSPDNETK